MSQGSLRDLGLGRASEEGGSLARPPSRLRRWIVLGVWLVVLGCAAGVVAYFVTYSPLHAAGAGAEGPRTQARGNEILVRYQAKKPVRVTVRVVNGGRFGITVTGIDQPPTGADFLVQPVRRVMQVDPDGGAWTVFQPFRLAPGASRNLGVVYRFKNCSGTPQGAGQAISSHTITFTLLGMNHTQDVDTGTKIIVRSAPNSQCKGRPKSQR